MATTKKRQKQETRMVRLPLDLYLKLQAAAREGNRPITRELVAIVQRGMEGKRDGQR